MTSNTLLKFDYQEYDLKYCTQELGKYSEKYSSIEYHLGMI